MSRSVGVISAINHTLFYEGERNLDTFFIVVLKMSTIVFCSNIVSLSDFKFTAQVLRLRFKAITPLNTHRFSHFGFQLSKSYILGVV